jgi:hypothetical protein
MVCGQALFFSRASPRVRLAPRAHLVFASVRLKYAKKYACSAGYIDIGSKCFPHALDTFVELFSSQVKENVHSKQAMLVEHSILQKVVASASDKMA